MSFKEINPKLQMNFNEYTQTWRLLLTEFYSRGLEPDLVYTDLSLKEDDMIRYSMELSAILLIVATRILNTRMRIPEDIRQKVCASVIDQFYSSLQASAPADFKEKCIEFYHVKYKIFDQLCPNIAGQDAKKRQHDLVGMARYLVAQVSGLEEQANMKAIEKLGFLFVDTATKFLQLAGNSSMDNQMLGRLKFIVQKN